MATKSAILAVKIISDAKDFKSGVDDAAGSMDKFGARIKGLAVPAGVAIAGLVGIGKAAGQAAADAQQSQGAADAAFGAWALSVDKLSKTSADRLGLAERDYDQFAAIAGVALRSTGLEGEALVSSTDRLLTAGADLSAMWGGTVSDALSAINAGMRGEYDALEKYGIKVNETTINDALRAKGLTNLTGAELEQAKAAERHNQIMSQLGPAQGAFAREADTAAGAQQRMSAQIDNAAASLGVVLLPAMTVASQVLAGMAGWVQQNTGLATGLAVVIGGLAAAILVANGVMAVHNAITGASVIAKGAAAIATGGWTVATNLLGLAMRALPIVAIIGLIMGLAGAIKWAYENVGWFRDAVNGMGRFAVDAFNNVSRAVQNAIGWVQRLFSGFSIPGWMRDVMNFMGMGAVGFDGGTDQLIGGPSLMGLGPDSGAVGAGTMAAMFSGSGSGSVTNNYYTIKVDGALDANAVARQIEDLLKRRSRNTGATSAAGSF